MPGSEDAYVLTILRLEKVLRAILHRYAPQPADLEDLLQETYSHLFSLTLERRHSIRNLQAFAITTARHIATDWVRHRKVVALDPVEEMTDFPVYEDGAGLDEIVHTHQQLLRLAHGVDQLPERTRNVFILRRVYGMSQKEIATTLNITEGAVEQHLNRGMRKCAELLGPSDSHEHLGWLERWSQRLLKKRTEG